MYEDRCFICKGELAEALSDVVTGDLMRTYEITERSIALGGGWNLKFYEDGEEAGGGVFLPNEHNDAVAEGESWVSPPQSRRHP